MAILFLEIEEMKCYYTHWCRSLSDWFHGYWNWLLEENIAYGTRKRGIKKWGDWRNCQFSGSTKWRVCRTSIRRTKKIDAAWIFTTWTKLVDGQWRGGFLVDRQASVKAVSMTRWYVKSKEGGVIRSRNNGEKEKEKMRRNLTSCFSLFSHP